LLNRNRCLYGETSFEKLSSVIKKVQTRRAWETSVPITFTFCFFMRYKLFIIYKTKSYVKVILWTGHYIIYKVKIGRRDGSYQIDAWYVYINY